MNNNMLNEMVSGNDNQSDKFNDYKGFYSKKMKKSIKNKKHKKHKKSIKNKNEKDKKIRHKRT